MQAKGDWCVVIIDRESSALLPWLKILVLAFSIKHSKFCFCGAKLCKYSESSMVSLYTVTVDGIVVRHQEGTLFLMKQVDYIRPYDYNPIIGLDISISGSPKRREFLLVFIGQKDRYDDMRMVMAVSVFGLYLLEFEVEIFFVI
jgi:hypothetical protein